MVGWPKGQPTMTGSPVRPASMTKILAIAWKDLRSTMRNVPALVMMLVAPLALAGLLGFAFGGGGIVPDRRHQGRGGRSGPRRARRPRPRRLPPPCPRGGARHGRAHEPRPARRARRDPQADGRRGAQTVDNGDAAVAVIIPADFSSALYGAQGERAAVELYENPTQGLGDAITTAVVEQTLLDFNGARAAAAAAAATAPAAGHDRAAAAAAKRFINGRRRRQGSRHHRSRAAGRSRRRRARTSGSPARSWPA